MRILLVDNYDSFTYNLYHLIAKVCGGETTVLRNDEWSAWHRLNLSDFDAAVISPGPGRPQRPADVGISRALLRDGRLPVLGVCLGHQELAYSCGATVRHAPQPVHGRASLVAHNGLGVFAGLPSPFSAVRYHSLEVADLPPDLLVTATTPADAGGAIVMGVQHRERPLWGVQFHPESILTEYGAELMDNFRRLAGGAGRAGVTPSRPPADKLAQADARATSPEPTVAEGSWHVEKRRFHCRTDTSSLFSRLFADDPCAFWLDSSLLVPGMSRFSIMGRRGPFGELVTARASSGHVQVDGPEGPTMVDSDLFEYLKSQIAARRISDADLPFDFCMGYVGYFGYEMKADCGGDYAHPSGGDDAALIFCDQAIVIDHERNEIWALTLSPAGGHRRHGDWLKAAEAAIACSQADGSDGQGPVALAHMPADNVSADVSPRFRHDLDQYAALVRDCLEEIRNGESYEVCLTNMVTVEADINPLLTYQLLRQRSPVPYGAFINLPDVSIMSASPECFLQISSSGAVRTKPIKGTRPRGATPEQDASLRAELATAEKDRSENLMIVDLLRNDLGRVAVEGSVRVPELFAVESYAPVHQLVSTVEAQLKPGVTSVDCLRAAFPGGSMTGAPKIRTMQIIDRLEGGPRGVYSGALGYLSLNGAAHLSIVIRTLVARGGTVTLGTGGAIVALSDPEAEVREILVKAAAPLGALQDSVRAAATVP